MTHYVLQANPCEPAECVACGAWDPDDPANDCPAWAALALVPGADRPSRDQSQ